MSEDGQSPHDWVQLDREVYPWPFCRVCGVVKRRDGLNKPCKGPTRLRRMALVRQAGETEQKEEK
jgi:hypothetical protein